MTKSEAKRIAERQVVARARELIAAHDKSHAAKPPPQKFGMNYGELNSLRDAIITLDSFPHST